ncbi:MAG: hypothetical protein Q9227_004243 [Pyrenula ochraceoflavens]
MEALSPRSTNVPSRIRQEMKKPAGTAVQKMQNNDKIDDKWRPAATITEPGNNNAYFVGKKLGKGGFAVCFEGKDSKTEKIFALKVVKSKVEQKKQLDKFRTELQIHAKMRHPNIVEFHRAFAFEEHTYVVLELCPNGSLMEMVKARGSLSLPEVRRFMIQLCGGVKYLHKRSVLHRDLKIGNLFLDKHMDVKIGDFGLAAISLPGDKRRQTLCGTPNYIAPEILDKDRSKGHDHQVDTWAIGIICFALLTGSPPFASKTQPEIYDKLKTLTYKWGSRDPNYYPQEAKDLVASCLNLNAELRPDMDELVEHEFFKMRTIAERLDMKVRKTEPDWLLECDPQGDSVTPGYGIAHDKICAAAGVGKLDNGKPRRSVGEKANRSAIIEVEAENLQGLAPVVPLAPGVIYQHFEEAREAWALSRKYPPLASRKEGTTSSGSIYTEESRSNRAKVNESSVIQKTASTLARPSFAATQRQQALPAKARKPHVPPSSSETENKENVEKEKDPRKYMQERPIRAGTARITRSNSSHQNTLVAKPALLPKSHSMTEGLSRSVAPQSSTSSKPRSYKTVRDQESIPKRVPSPMQEEDVPKNAARVRSYKTLRVGAEVKSLKALTNECETAQEKPLVCSGRQVSTLKPAFELSTKGTEPALPTKPRDKTSIPPDAAGQVKAVKENIIGNIHSSSSISSSSRDSGSDRPESKDSDSSQPPFSDPPIQIQSSKPTRATTATKCTLTSAISHSSSSDLLSAISSLHDSLRPATKTSLANPAVHVSHPVVEKWVDYSNKYGLGYVLSDDSVGCIFTPEGRSQRHRGCIIRDHRESVLRRREDRDWAMDKDAAIGNTVDMYEEDDVEEGMVGVVSTPIEQVRGLSHPAERAKMLQVCDRLGRYMCMKSAADWPEDNLPSHTFPQHDGPMHRNYIRFYVRMGNVGIWGFGPKLAMQVNWPDHTKIMLHPDWEEEVEVDDASLPTRARTRPRAKQIIKRRAKIDIFYYERCVNSSEPSSLLLSSNLKEEDIQAEGVASLSVDLSAPMSRAEEEIVEKVRVREKVRWLKGVLSTWLVEGGVGKMGEGSSRGRGRRFWVCEGGGEKLEWRVLGMGGS